jgi:hypothetical protein
MSKKQLKEICLQDIKDVFEEAKNYGIPICRCTECGKPFYTFFTEHNARYERFMDGENLTCIDHTPIDLIIDSLSKPQN